MDTCGFLRLKSKSIVPCPPKHRVFLYMLSNHERGELGSPACYSCKAWVLSALLCLKSLGFRSLLLCGRQMRGKNGGESPSVCLSATNLAPPPPHQWGLVQQRSHILPTFSKSRGVFPAECISPCILWLPQIESMCSFLNILKHFIPCVTCTRTSSIPLPLPVYLPSPPEPLDLS